MLLLKIRRIFILVLLSIMVLLAACGGNDDVESGKIVVAGKEYTEQIILTHIFGEYLKENTDLDVKVEDALGGAFVLHEAMLKGDIDLFVEYTGTGYLNVLKKEYEPGTDPDEFYEETKEGYLDEFDFKWLKPLGFNNQYALTLRGEQIEELGIETTADLAEHADELVFGSTGEFYERGDGYDEMIEEYDLNFKNTVIIDDDLMYAALKNGDLDVITGYTTDPRISEFNLYNIEDENEFFPPYGAVPVIPVEILDANPGLEEILDKLAESGIFTDEKMVELNGKVSTDGEKEIDVAREFLKENDLID